MTTWVADDLADTGAGGAWLCGELSPGTQRRDLTWAQQDAHRPGAAGTVEASPVSSEPFPTADISLTSDESTTPARYRVWVAGVGTDRECVAGLRSLSDGSATTDLAGRAPQVDPPMDGLPEAVRCAAVSTYALGAAAVIDGTYTSSSAITAGELGSCTLVLDPDGNDVVDGMERFTETSVVITGHVSMDPDVWAPLCVGDDVSAPLTDLPHGWTRAQSCSSNGRTLSLSYLVVAPTSADDHAALECEVRAGGDQSLTTLAFAANEVCDEALYQARGLTGD
ncbi:hypothetical protein [Microbacterium trichothecenolyticum]|uniref:hypothetical protein n=1 Tax=Microbacterium trichothecenolyticum TaxID=69370 RepID=UPI0027D81B68|nr:hypothetical protein [Microbacterium trichothecenolyticum]